MGKVTAWCINTHYCLYHKCLCVSVIVVLVMGVGCSFGRINTSFQVQHHHHWRIGQCATCDQGVTNSEVIFDQAIVNCSF